MPLKKNLLVILLHTCNDRLLSKVLICFGLVGKRWKALQVLDKFIFPLSPHLSFSHFIWRVCNLNTYSCTYHFNIWAAGLVPKTHLISKMCFYERKVPRAEISLGGKMIPGRNTTTHKNGRILHLLMTVVSLYILHCGVPSSFTTIMSFASFAPILWYRNFFSLLHLQDKSKANNVFVTQQNIHEARKWGSSSVIHDV